MDEQRAVARNVARQREWYGEPLGDRVRRLVVAFNVSQAQLAEVLGLSAPMLSQLMSGRRAKIGNPAVLARMVMLERRVLTPAVASGDPTAIRAALEEVRDSRPTISRPTVSGSTVSGSTVSWSTGGDSTGGDSIGGDSIGGDSIGGDSIGGDSIGGEKYGDEVLGPALRAVAAPAELAGAAELLQDRFPVLAALLRRAAGPGQESDVER